GGDYEPSIRMLAEAMSKFNAAATVAELADANNVAIVALTATVPENGVRNGDKLDVEVTSIGSAKSLEGGRLFVTPLGGPMPGSGFFALAEGALILDPLVPTVASIEDGAVMEVDLPKQFVKNGTFTLVLADAHASFTNASHIARMINDSESMNGEEIAVAIDPKNVLVTLPRSERARPDGFISRVLRLPVPMIAEEARVRINQRLGTIIITGDVEIDPTVITMPGLTISTVIEPENPPAVRRPDPFAVPQIKTTDFVPLASDQTKLAKLKDLLAALDQLKVPAPDRIAIIKELHKTGKMHAELVVE
ncbi:MAG: flagellar basal body P-ring protein FlgI, partial [Planctomycetota bacterium]